MPSTLRLLADGHNAAADATVSASSIAAASDRAFRRPTTRTGQGRVSLTGGYTGAADALIDIDIATPATGNERASQPAFAGAGNGIMTAPTVAGGSSAQDWTVALVDLGTTTTQSQAILYADVLLQAKTAGAAGNSITLNVAPNLAVGTAVGVLAADLARDTQEWSDQKLDFGAVPLNPDGTLAATCPRLIFGGDTSRVYRHYKRWDGTQWQYGVSPKLAAAYPAGALVNAVSGDYAATVTLGATVESYSGTTLYDLLLAFTTSNLITVASTIAKDLKPGGMAAIDVPVRTAAFALPVEKSRSDLPDLSGVTVAVTAPTETVTVTCIDDSAIGGEVWQVKSKVAGALANALTGEPYTAGFVGFTVPLVPLGTRPVSGRFAITDFAWATVSPRSYPDICLNRPLLGAAATAATLRLVWTQRPADDCDCTNARIAGHPVETYLGIDLEEETLMTLPAAYQTRLQTLYAWRATWTRNNTGLANGRVYGALPDLDLADKITDLFAAALADGIYANATAASAWDSALTAMQSDITTIAGQTGYDADGWPTGAKEWKPGTSVSIGDYVKSVDTDDAPVCWKVTNTAKVLLASPNTITYGSATTIVTPTVGNPPSTTYDVLPQLATIPGDGAYSGWWASAGLDASYNYWVRLRSITPDTELAATAAELDTFARRYASKMDEIRAIAGLVPKSVAGRKGNDVWQDLGGDYWVIQGTDYLPVFNNTYYHGCVKQYDPDTGCETIVPTHEFGFALAVDCPDRLQYGDTVILTIGEVAVDRPYLKGDSYSIPVVAGGPLSFSGGITGTDTLVWTVVGSVSGALSPYALTALEPPYSGGGLGFTIHRGSLAFALGDTFTFSVTTGERFQWRRDGGAWSSATAIAASVALADGLYADFTPGPAPSFAPGDRHSFQVLQPNAPDHVRAADLGYWTWTGSSAYLVLTWASDQTVSCVGVLQHALAGSATCSIALKNSGGSTLATVPLTVRSGPMVAFLDAPLTTVRSMVITLANAAGMSLGWVYAGVPLATSHQPDSLRLERRYAVERGGGWNPRGAYLGAGQGGEIVWRDWLLQEDLDALLAVIDAAKAAGDAPVCIVPHYQNPTEATLCRIDSDAIQIEDIFDFQPDDLSRRRLSLTLPLAAVLQ